MKTFKISVILTALLWASYVSPSTLARENPIKVNKKDLVCLAQNIYHEARGEPLEGQIAVAQVTLNRVKSRDFHPTVCGVVYADKQFSWTDEPLKPIQDMKAWQSSLKIADAILARKITVSNFKALYFHTKQVNPKWSHKKQIIAKIGNHIFYS